MWNWIVLNKQWVFSGVGVSFLAAVWWFLKKAVRPESRIPLATPTNNSVVQAPAISVAPVFNLPHVGTSSQQPSPAPSPQIPPARPEPNLVFCRVYFERLFLVSDEFCVYVSQGMENRFPLFRGIVAEIMNASNPTVPVGPAKHVKAELVIRLEDRDEIFGPLPWTETNCNTVSIEMGNPARIVLAIFRVSRIATPPGEWTVPVNHRSRADLMPGANRIDFKQFAKRGEVAVQLRILQPESGRVLRIFDGLCRWGKNSKDPEFDFGP